MMGGVMITAAAPRRWRLQAQCGSRGMTKDA
jgi:hypothetical protein